LDVIVIVIGFFFFSMTITMTTHDHEGRSLAERLRTTSLQACPNPFVKIYTNLTQKRLPCGNITVALIHPS
jgi:hypothetical protein